jgi:hypothetical protein
MPRQNKKGGNKMFSYDREYVNLLKQKYPQGTRVKLLYTSDLYTRLQSGECGTIRIVDDIGTIHVNWDCGSRLGLIPGEDSFEII